MIDYENQKITQALYDSTTDMIYDYLCFHRDKKCLDMLPNLEIVNRLRFDSLNYLKQQMDLLLMGWKND